MSCSEKKEPDCFADLETVFPMGKDGLRHSPDDCLGCRYKIECLRAAVRGRGGLKVREEQIDRAYRSGAIGFLERWSLKKAIDRRKKRS